MVMDDFCNPSTKIFILNRSMNDVRVSFDSTSVFRVKFEPTTKSLQGPIVLNVGAHHREKHNSCYCVVLQEKERRSVRGREQEMRLPAVQMTFTVLLLGAKCHHFGTFRSSLSCWFSADKRGRAPRRHTGRTERKYNPGSTEENETFT